MVLLPSCEALPDLADELRYALSGRSVAVVDGTAFAGSPAPDDVAGCAPAARLEADFSVRLHTSGEDPFIFVCDVAAMTERRAPMPSGAASVGISEAVAIVVISLMDEASEPPPDKATPGREATDAPRVEVKNADSEKPWAAAPPMSESSPTLRRLNPAVFFVGLGLTVVFSVAAVLFSNASSQTATLTTDDETGSTEKTSRPHPAFCYASIAAAAAFGTATTIVAIGFTDWSFGRGTRTLSGMSARPWSLFVGLHRRF